MPTFEEMVVQLSEQVRTRLYGKYRGLVTDVEDPEDLGRIKATVPSVYEAEDSPWAMPAVAFAGASHSFLVLPEVGDGVWIEFEAGDPSRPIWTGCWWAQGEMPDPKGPKKRNLITSTGMKIVLDDDSTEMQLIHPGGGEITFTNTDLTIKYGATVIKLSSAGVDVNNGALKVI